jgi:uncharacterized membrane protein YbhN (UPF0104 family)
MTGRTLRVLWPIALVTTCVTIVLFGFDWTAVGARLATVDALPFLLLTGAITFFAFVMRGLRWVALAGLPFTAGAIWDAQCYVAVSVAAASATPMQAGEALKLHFARRSSGMLLARSGFAFAMERVADLVAVVTLLAVGLAAHGGGVVPATIAALIGLAALCLMPAAARHLAGARYVPPVATRVLVPLAEVRVSGPRFAIFLLCTAAKWASVIVLWRVPLEAAGVRISLADTALLVAGTTLAGIVSLVPGAIGVAEVSTRVLLTWMGIEPGPAEAAAIALRLLSLVLIAIGLLHALPMFLRRRATSIQ